ncbi:MAG: hypothetical protein M3Y77_03250 [Actinomycetota bacterium]|nr:hypothetical protein [Actinomycetota bacterium]
MNIDKNTVMDLIRSKGDQSKTDQAQQELPDTVDTGQHAGLLSKLGIDPKELIGKFGGLGDKLGI